MLCLSATNNLAELSSAVDARQKLESQQQENKGVQQVDLAIPGDHMYAL
jgi:hypothetical protein